ncbi:hypothetical protein [Streptomyces sp. NPDC051286]|uniref:hypothetical protein n=1 Tax=Streptomyces sp. NPDC051286 TaxID=3365647 RepID=UPI00378DC6FC
MHQAVSGQAAQETTTQAVVGEFSRMRTNLREVRDQPASGGDMLNREVRRAVAQLRDEMREVKEAVDALAPPNPPVPAAPLTDNGSGPVAHEIPLPPETTGSLTAGAAPTPVAVAVRTAAPRDGDGAVDTDGPVVPVVSVEEIRRAVRV